jgi:hypothetical protein
MARQLELRMVKEDVRVWVGELREGWPRFDRRAAIEVDRDGILRVVMRNEDMSAPDVFSFEPGVEVSFKVVNDV